jgi:hypothetical protein
MTESPKFAVSIAQVTVDALSADAMTRVIRVGDREAFEYAEVCLNQVGPGGLGGRVDRLDAEPAQQGQEPRMIVDVTGGCAK